MPDDKAIGNSDDENPLVIDVVSSERTFGAILGATLATQSAFLRDGKDVEMVNGERLILPHSTH